MIHNNIIYDTFFQRSLLRGHSPRTRASQVVVLAGMMLRDLELRWTTAGGWEVVDAEVGGPFGVVPWLGKRESIHQRECLVNHHEQMPCECCIVYILKLHNPMDYSYINIFKYYQFPHFLYIGMRCVYAPYFHLSISY